MRNWRPGRNVRPAFDGDGDGMTDQLVSPPRFHRRTATDGR